MTAAGVDRKGRRLGLFHSVYTINKSDPPPCYGVVAYTPVGISSSEPLPSVNHNGSPFGARYATYRL